MASINKEIQGKIMNLDQVLEKRDGLWCGGARDTREPRVTIG